MPSESFLRLRGVVSNIAHDWGTDFIQVSRASINYLERAATGKLLIRQF
jgi:hypothetical protein